MNVKFIAGGLGGGRARLALRPRSVRLPASHWGLSDFVALTKPRVMMLAIFTALVGLGLAPSRPNSLALRASVVSDSVHSSTRRLSSAMSLLGAGELATNRLAVVKLAPFRIYLRVGGSAPWDANEAVSS
jgi:hypothetical protein